MGERRDLSARFHRRWKLDNLPSRALQVWGFLRGGDSLQVGYPEQQLCRASTKRALLVGA